MHANFLDIAKSSLSEMCDHMEDVRGYGAATGLTPAPQERATIRRMADSDLGAPTTILRTLDPALLGVAKSLLDAARIPFFAKGEALRMARGGGPIELQVPADRSQEAEGLLADLRSSSNR